MLYDSSSVSLYNSDYPASVQSAFAQIAPYIIPMNYGYDSNKIYLHSAKEGKKIDILQRNNKVCFEITDSIETIKSESACNFGTIYRTVIGFGRICSSNRFFAAG